MKFFETSTEYYLNKSTYINLRWIAYIGQLITILSVRFIFELSFDYLLCISIVFFGTLSNLYLLLKLIRAQKEFILKMKKNLKNLF